jgi:hypothetical protein
LIFSPALLQHLPFYSFYPLVIGWFNALVIINSR